MAETLELGRISAPPRPAPPVDDAPEKPIVRGKARPLSLAESAVAALDERRLFTLLPFAMIVGLIVSVELPDEPMPVALAVGAVVIGAAMLTLRHSLTTLRLGALGAAFWIGLSLLPIHGALFGTAMLSRPAYGTYQTHVDEVLSETMAEQRVIVSAITAVGDARAVAVRRARLIVKGGPQLAPGDVIEGPIRFASVPGPVYPGGFDTQFHAFFDGIGAYGNSTQPPRIVTVGENNSPLRIVDSIRSGIAARIDADLAQPAAGIARAIINGDQSAVTDEAREVMSTAGIAHVLSVSGLHLTIVAGGVFWVLRLVLSAMGGVVERLPVKRLAALGGMAAALFYFSISGGNVAALRSTLMILLVFGAVLAGRRALTMRNVAFAALIIVLTDPASVFRPSFQLSFAAVVALVGAYENFRSDRARDAGLVAHGWAYAKGVVLTSVVAGAATLLFSAYHFQQTSPLGVLGNLATLPLVGFIMMPAAVLAVIAMPFGGEGPFLAAMGWSIDAMLWVAGYVAQWSTGLRASPLLTPLALVIGLAALGWFAFLRDRWRLLGPAVAIPAVIFFAFDRPPDVLIADTTQSMAIRGSTGLELADGRPQSFALDVWRETYAEPIEAEIAKSCDSVACIGESSAGFSWALVDDAAGFSDECGRADLIVTRLTAPSWCRAKALIDADDLEAHGVHWLRWDYRAADFESRSAIGALNRPWRVTP